MSKKISGPLDTFTAIFPGFDHNEEAAANTIAEKIRSKKHLIEINESDWLSLGLACMKQQDEPIASSSVFAQFAVYRAIADQGIKVVIDGQGADETLAGYERYYPWYWQELFRQRKLNASEEQKHARRMGIEVAFNWKNKLAVFFPDLAAQQRKRAYQKKASSDPILRPLAKNDRFKKLNHVMPEHPGLNGALYFNTCTHGLEELLRYADRNSMRFGLEVRLPFLSHSLVEFVFSLPASYKIRQGWRKWILRQSMSDRLPSNICWNPKKIGYETPQARWMQRPEFQEAIRNAREVLIDQEWIHPSVRSTPIRTEPAFSATPRDWRILSLASLFG
jgi:asparagine synthase (glutamine-hydrolysing)